MDNPQRRAKLAKLTKTQLVERVLDLEDRYDDVVRSNTRLALHVEHLQRKEASV